MTSRRSIIVRAEAIGFHCWPSAPAPVTYLQSPHRHLFKVSAQFDVTHGDRQLEFHIVQAELKAFVDALYENSALVPLHLSCENMAELLFNQLRIAYPQIRKVVVSEDGENDGIYELVP